MGQINLQVPIIGQPNSTEDPKIISDFNTLQTWANGNIDQSNIAATAGFWRLGVRSVSSNTVAANGDWIRTTGSSNVTITLPAPTQNAVVAVYNFTTATTTVSAGVTIFGIGFQATSFALGTISAFAVLQSDGTNWYVVAGQQDTGWVALTLATNVNTTAGAYTPSVRRVGDQIRFSGMATNNTGGTINFGSTIATLPSSAFAPANHVWLMGIPGGGVYDIAAASTSIINENAISNGGFIYFDYLSYRLS